MTNLTERTLYAIGWTLAYHKVWFGAFHCITLDFSWECALLRVRKFQIMKGFALIGLLALSNHAAADNVYIVQDPQAALIDGWNKRAEEDRRRMAQSFANVGAALQARKTVVRAVLAVNCGRAGNLIRVFGDGHSETTDMGGKAMSDADILQARAAWPFLQIVQSCDQ